MPAGKDARQRDVSGLAKLEAALELRISECIRLQRPDVATNEITPQPPPLARGAIGGACRGGIWRGALDSSSSFWRAAISAIAESKLEGLSGGELR
jgi:hypothetical protein